MPLLLRRRLLGLLVAFLALAGAAFATYRLEAHGDGQARRRAAQLATTSLHSAREVLQGLLRGMESRVSSGAALGPVRALVSQRVDAVTLQDAFATEPWWQLFREEFSQHVLVTGASRFQYAPNGTVLAADLSPVLPVDSGRPVRSGVVLAGGAPHLAASALVDVPEAGSGPRTRLVLARPLSVADLEELARAARSALALTDAKGRLLGRLGGVPMADTAFPEVLARGGAAPHTDGRGDWAAARAEVAPGVHLWAVVDSRPEADHAREPYRAVMLPLWFAALLVAGSALRLGLRAPRDDVTKELLARTTQRLAEAEAQIKRLTTSLPAVRRAPGPAPLSPPRPTRGVPSLESPVPFGRYELLRPIGQGGMARVYLALARGTGGFERLFVIKRLHEPLAHQPRMVSLFMDEARLGASLTHSNIISVYDFGQVDGEYYMASEYILGRDLDLVVRRAVTREGHALEPGTVFHLAQQVLEALAYAHSRTDAQGRPLGIVHRDVSPMNVLASARGEVKLFDFGIAKSASRSTHTQAGLVKGNVNFIAPEQARGLAVDARADLFSLGLTLYWCLTGELLYSGPTDYDQLVKAACGPAEAEWERINRLPSPAAELLRRALQPSPADRFQSAEEFSRALPPTGTAGAATLARTMLRLFGDELRTEAAYRSRLAQRQPRAGAL